MRLSGVIASLAFIGLVPSALALAYLGYSQGLYPYTALPLVFGGVILVCVIGLFAVLPRLRERERY